MTDRPRIDLSDAPPAIAILPREARGFPIPDFVYRPATFKPGDVLDMRLLDPDRALAAAKAKRCGVCGQPLGYRMFFIGGPMCLSNRIFETPMHLDCARFSLVICPHLFRSGSERSTRPTTATMHDPNAVKERPPYLVLVTTRGYKILERNPDTGRELPKPLLKIDPWSAVEWMNDGGTPTDDRYAVITNALGQALYCFSCISQGIPAISFHPDDVEQRFCSSCHRFLAVPVVIEVPR